MASKIRTKLFTALFVIIYWRENLPTPQPHRSTSRRAINPDAPTGPPVAFAAQCKNCCWVRRQDRQRQATHCESLTDNWSLRSAVSFTQEGEMQHRNWFFFCFSLLKFPAACSVADAASTPAKCAFCAGRTANCNYCHTAFKIRSSCALAGFLPSGSARTSSSKQAVPQQWNSAGPPSHHSGVFVATVLGANETKNLKPKPFFFCFGFCSG